MAMKFEKTLVSGSTAMLVLSLLSDGDKYGYEMVTELARRSNNAFDLKEGTLYPLLHALEKAGRGRGRLQEKTEEWNYFAESVNAVLRAAVSPAG